MAGPVSTLRTVVEKVTCLRRLSVAKYDQKVSIPLFGGFGNQLFALAASLYFRERFDRVIRLDPSFQLLAELFGNTKRVFELGDVSACDIEIVQRSHLRVLNFFLSKYLSRNSWLSESPTTTWDSVTYNPKLRVVYGYFQDRQIVDPYFDVLCNVLATSSEFSSIFRGEVVDQICFHLRLGDKPAANHLFGETSSDYYVRAIELAVEKSGLSYVSVVSDQPKKADSVISELMQRISGVRFRLASNVDYLNDFHNLIWSRAIVMSCSSFSWWASRFADYFHSPVIIAPSPWNASDLSSEKRLNYPHWHTIPKVKVHSIFPL